MLRRTPGCNDTRTSTLFQRRIEYEHFLHIKIPYENVQSVHALGFHKISVDHSNERGRK